MLPVELLCVAGMAVCPPGVAGSGRFFILYVLLEPALLLFNLSVELPDAVVRRPRLSYTGSVAAGSSPVDVGLVGGNSSAVVAVELTDGLQLGVRGFRGMVT